MLSRFAGVSESGVPGTRGFRVTGVSPGFPPDTNFVWWGGDPPLVCWGGQPGEGLNFPPLSC
jgi:hypothetical protein